MDVTQSEPVATTSPAVSAEPTSPIARERLIEAALPVGVPLSAGVTDEEGVLLLERGAVLASEADRAFLFAHFTPYSQPHPVPPRPPAEASAISVKDMQLSIGTRLGIRRPLGGGRTTHASRVIGLASHNALFIASPTAANERLPVLPGEQLDVVAVTGRSVFLFSCTVEAVCSRPFHYLVLSPPGVIKRLRQRKAERVGVKLAVSYRRGTAAVTGAALGPTDAPSDASNDAALDDTPLSGLGIAYDISALGMSLTVAKELGPVSSLLHLTFYLDIDQTPIKIEIDAVIRAIKQPVPDMVPATPVPAASSAPGTGPAHPLIQYGLEFVDIKQKDKLALRGFVLGQLQGEGQGSGA